MGAQAVDLGARSPGGPGRGALRGLGLGGLGAAAQRRRAGVAVQALGRPARVRGPVGRFALQRDLHGRAAGGPRVRGAQELRDEHGGAARERARGARGAGVRPAAARQRVEGQEKVVLPLLLEDLGLGGCVAATGAKMKPKPMGHGAQGGREGEDERRQPPRRGQKSETEGTNSKKKRPICQTFSTAARRATDSRNNPSGQRHSRHDWVRAKSSHPHCDRG